MIHRTGFTTTNTGRLRPADEHVIATARARRDSGKLVRRQRFTERVTPPQPRTDRRVLVSLFGLASLLAAFGVLGTITVL
jgi:hypothetical protein